MYSSMPNFRLICTCCRPLPCDAKRRKVDYILKCRAHIPFPSVITAKFCTQEWAHGVLFRQHCEQRKVPVFKLRYSEADFGAIRCTNGGEIWHGGVGRWPLKIQILKIQDGGSRRLKKIEKSPYLSRSLTDFDQIWHGGAVWQLEPFDR